MIQPIIAKMLFSPANQVQAHLTFPPFVQARVGFQFRFFYSFSTDCNIAISTYSMVSFTGKRSWEAGEVSEKSQTARSGLLY